MISTQLIDKRNKLMHDATKLIQSDKVSTEQRASFDAMMAEVDTLDADIARVKRTEEFESEQRSATRPPRSQPGEQESTPESTKAERRAFSDYIRFGRVDNTVLRENRDLGVGAVAGSITGGSQLVPTAFYPVLTEAQKAWGALTTAVNTKKTDTGAPMNFALVNDTGNQLSVIGEATTVSEADPTLAGAISYTDFTTTGVIKVTLPELQDSAFDIDAFIRDSFGKRYYRGVTQFITAGSSTTHVQSIVSTATVAATSFAPTVISYADIVATYGALDPAYEQNATWVLNSTTRAFLMGVTDTLGRPLFIPSPNSGAFDTLLGRPVILNQYQANIAAGNKALMFGDLKAGYTLRTVGDLSIVRMNERYLDQGEIGFIGFARVGGFATDAGTHPIVVLQQHA
jgi:HK97 family phage major capsid protein